VRKRDDELIKPKRIYGAAQLELDEVVVRKELELAEEPRVLALTQLRSTCRFARSQSVQRIDKRSQLSA
jgi:hypothetical protein